MNTGSKIDGNDLTFKSDSGAQGVVTEIAKNADSVKLLIADEVNRNEVVIIKKDATVTVDKDDLARIYYGNNAGVDFSNVTENLSIDLSGVIDIHSDTPLMFKGITQIKTGSGRNSVIGSDADETLIAGKGDTSLYGAGGNNVLRGNSDQTAPTEFFVFGGANDASTTIENFQFGTDKLNFLREESNAIEVTKVDSTTGDVSIKVTNTGTNVYETAIIKGGANKKIQVSDLNGNTVIGQVAASAVTVNNDATFYQVMENGGTLVVGSDVTGSKKLWLGDIAHSDGIEIVGDIAVIDASGSSAQLELAGNNLDNTITAGSGNSSLWGGNLGDDLLVGGEGKNTFYYTLGNGNDTISGVNDGDIVDLTGVSLESIIGADFTNNAVALNFIGGGKLTVNENGKDLGFVVADKTFYVNNEHNGFVAEK